MTVLWLLLNIFSGIHSPYYGITCVSHEGLHKLIMFKRHQTETPRQLNSSQDIQLADSWKRKTRRDKYIVSSLVCGDYPAELVMTSRVFLVMIGCSC